MLSKDSANAYRVYWKKDAFYEELIEKGARYGGMKMLKAIVWLNRKQRKRPDTIIPEKSFRIA